VHNQRNISLQASYPLKMARIKNLLRGEPFSRSVASHNLENLLVASLPLDPLLNDVVRSKSKDARVDDFSTTYFGGLGNTTQ
jgi:hypothetical protein